MRRLPGVLGLLISAMIWGLSWWPLQRLQRLGVDPLWSTSLLFSGVVVAISLIQPQAWVALWRSRRLWLVLLVSGLTNTLFNLGITTGDVVRVVLLFYLMPVWIVPIAWLVLREPVSGQRLLQLVVATSGALVVLWPDAAHASLHLQAGDWMGLLAGVCFALNTVLLRHDPDADRGGRVLAMFLGSSLIATVLALGLTVPALPPPRPEWLALACGLAGLYLISNLAMQHGASALPANVSAVIMLTEVLWATGSSVWLGAGHASLRLLLGGALIVGSATLAALE